MKILIADDNPTNQELVVQFLMWKGHEVLTALDGEQAVRMARAERPDIILMDLGMPILSGWEAIRYLKTSRETAGIPILALTAHAMELDIQRAIEAGCDAYMLKPMDLINLHAQIETLVSSGIRR